MRRIPLGLIALSILGIAGCRSAQHDAIVVSKVKAQPTPKLNFANVDAGLPVQPGDYTKLPSVVTASMATSRPDPFALLPKEQAFEKNQLASNLVGLGGTFPNFYEPPPEVQSAPEVEPQPRRRLAGILIGDSVSALIDMGNGQLLEIHPGTRIQGTEWMVQSIDSDKAVLRRVGSRKLPTEVVVRLETSPTGPAAPPTLTNPGVNPGNPGGAPSTGRGRGRFGGAGG